MVRVGKRHEGAYSAKASMRQGGALAACRRQDCGGAVKWDAYEGYAHRRRQAFAHEDRQASSLRASEMGS